MPGRPHLQAAPSDPGGGEASRVVAAPSSSLLSAFPSNDQPNLSYFLEGKNLDVSLLSSPLPKPGTPVPGPRGRGRAAPL